MSKAKAEALITKDEALHLLSAQLRRPGIEPELFVKVLNLYAKISGWDEEPTPPQPEKTIDELVKEAEAKRKATN